MDGYLNVDSCFPKDSKNWDAFHCDLSMHWPWPDSTVDFIVARDIIEHLPNKIQTMNEAWRVLKPRGIIRIEVPTTDGPGAFQDPTHVSFWHLNSFKYYERGNIYRDRFARGYGIEAAFRVLLADITTSQDGPRLTINLEAVKDEAD